MALHYMAFNLNFMLRNGTVKVLDEKGNYFEWRFLDPEELRRKCTVLALAL